MVSYLYRVEMAAGSLSYARDILCVKRETLLVSYPILDPWQGAVIFTVYLWKLQLLVYADDVIVLGEYLQTVRENTEYS